jgi:hypothetical protein
LISGSFQRRSRALFWSTLASAILHVILLTLAFLAAARLFVPRGQREAVSETTIVTIQHQIRSTPKPAPRPVRHTSAPQRQSAPAHVPLPEIAKQVTVAATPAPPARRPSVPSKIERDEAGFAKEIARLNQQNDAHAIPTIDPGARESPSKSYAFDVPSALRGDEHGNGIITPTQRWRDNGRDCYYGRYEFTYPDGAEEYGSIVWPFCYDAAVDPFKLPPHEIPFPFPLPGYRLPPDTQLPPIEKSVYQEWISDPGLSAP